MGKLGPVAFVVAAVLLAAIAGGWTYTATRSALTGGLNLRLADAGARANVNVLDLERDHLVLVRDVSFTAGVGDALQRRDVLALQSLVTPLQANAGVPIVDVLDPQGNVVLAVRGAGAPAPVASRASWPIVTWVLNGQTDQYGVRNAALVIGSDGVLMVTVGPVQSGNQIVGAVLVATPVTDWLNRVAGNGPLRMTVYGTDGTALATNLTDAPPAVPANQARAIVDGSQTTDSRDLSLKTAGVHELLGRMEVRHQPVGVLGVSTTDQSIVVALRIASTVGVGFLVAMLLSGGLASRLLVRSGAR